MPSLIVALAAEVVGAIVGFLIGGVLLSIAFVGVAFLAYVVYATGQQRRRRAEAKSES